MDKQNTTQIKGIAILFMIWLHCFHIGWFTELYNDFTFMGNHLSSILTRLTGPVEFYIILSGYGLYCLYSKKQKIIVWARAKKLYLLFLLCFTIFIPLACYLKPDMYPGSISTFISNITAWHTTYNSTWWFLFPYIVILLCSNYILALFERHNLRILYISGLTYIAGYMTSWLSYHSYILIPYILHQCLVILNFLFPFIIGVCFAKFHITESLKEWYNKRVTNKYVFISIVLIITCIRLCTSFDFLLQIIYTLTIICAYSILPHYSATRKTLHMFGSHSTSMWFVHAFFNMYLFTDYIYTLKYPIFIYVFCVSLSLMSAMIIDKLFERITNIVFINNKLK